MLAAHMVIISMTVIFMGMPSEAGYVPISNVESFGKAEILNRIRKTVLFTYLIMSAMMVIE